MTWRAPGGLIVSSHFVTAAGDTRKGNERAVYFDNPTSP